MLSEWFGTTEAGAGSYPEPPDVPEYNGPECAECGDYGEGAKLREHIDGRILCKWCREKETLKAASLSEMLEFIVNSPYIETFAKELTEHLSEHALWFLLQRGMYYWDEEDRVEFLKNFLDTDTRKTDFLDFMEEAT